MTNKIYIKDIASSGGSWTVEESRHKDPDMVQLSLIFNIKDLLNQTNDLLRESIAESRAWRYKYEEERRRSIRLQNKLNKLSSK